MNDKAWESLFEKYDILNHIKQSGKYVISSAQIKEFREPRLMAKFDHSTNLPDIFTKNHLAILPVSRGDYVISDFEAYHTFEETDTSLIKASIPSMIQSLDSNHIPSEAIAINCALASGILSDFLDEEILYATVSGRMGSGQFNFNITNSSETLTTPVSVNSAQIEIDAAFEGVNCLALLEAKRDLSQDFLVRQLYYPFRALRQKVTKKVKPIFMVYSNGIFSLYEYEFRDPELYNSLVLVKHQNYTIEDTSIDICDLQTLLNEITCINEPKISFPQADNFERIINLCELLETQDLSREQVTLEYAFDIRQTNYYTDAARYLGLVEKDYLDGRKPFYKLTSLGERVMRLNYKQKQLEFCRLILQHRVFRDVFALCLENGMMPEAKIIVKRMKESGLFHIKSDKTYYRRASTITGWINWILKLLK